MTFTAALTQCLKEKSDKERAAQMSSYMRDQFDFFGVMAKERQECLKETIREIGIPSNAIEVAKELFQAPQRELNICGQELLLRAKKQWTTTSMKDFEWFISTKSWWDSVDFLASNVVGEYLKRFPDVNCLLRLHSWNRSDNMWLQRTSILYQLKYKGKTDTEVLSQFIEPHIHQTEFFIKKAIGWALREYSKTDPVWVENFVAEHELQPLSEKEALRLIK